MNASPSLLRRLWELQAKLTSAQAELTELCQAIEGTKMEDDDVPQPKKQARVNKPDEDDDDEEVVNKQLFSKSLQTSMKVDTLSNVRPEEDYTAFFIANDPSDWNILQTLPPTQAVSNDKGKTLVLFGNHAYLRQQSELHLIDIVKLLTTAKAEEKKKMTEFYTNCVHMLTQPLLALRPSPPQLYLVSRCLENLLTLMQLFAQLTVDNKKYPQVNIPTKFKEDAVVVLHTAFDYSCKHFDTEQVTQVWTEFIKKLLCNRYHRIRHNNAPASYVHDNIHFIIFNFLAIQPATHKMIESLMSNEAIASEVAKHHSRDNNYALQQLAKNKFPYKTHLTEYLLSSFQVREAFMKAFKELNPSQFNLSFSKVLLDWSSYDTVYDSSIESVLLGIEQMQDSDWESDEHRLFSLIVEKYCTDDDVSDPNIYHKVDSFLQRQVKTGQNKNFLNNFIKLLCIRLEECNLRGTPEVTAKFPFHLVMLFISHLTKDYSSPNPPSPFYMQYIYDHPLTDNEANILLLKRYIELSCRSEHPDALIKFNSHSNSWFQTLFNFFRFRLEYDVDDLDRVTKTFFSEPIVKLVVSQLLPTDSTKLCYAVVGWCKQHISGNKYACRPNKNKCVPVEKRSKTPVPQSKIAHLLKIAATDNFSDQATAAFKLLEHKRTLCLDDYLYAASLKSEYSLRLLYTFEDALTTQLDEANLYQLVMIAYEAFSPSLVYLYERYKTCFNQFQDPTYMLATYAARDGRLDVLKLVQKVTGDTRSIVSAAVHSKSVECVMYLLEQGFDYSFDEVFEFLREATTF